MKNITKKMIKTTLVGLSLSAALIISPAIFADDYVIDKKGMHASIQFKISHLGYSWLWGRFNDFDGSFSYDAKNKAASKVSISVNTKSVDSNHAERDKHLRGSDFLDVATYPEATFTSTSYVEGADGKAKLKGNLTLHGVSKEVELDVTKIAEGQDPWGGYRSGFEAVTNLKLKDYGINKNLGPASASLELIIALEGVKK